jgi:hypothetical protein
MHDGCDVNFNSGVDVIRKLRMRGLIPIRFHPSYGLRVKDAEKYSPCRPMRAHAPAVV